MKSMAFNFGTGRDQSNQVQIMLNTNSIHRSDYSPLIPPPIASTARGGFVQGILDKTLRKILLNRRKRYNVWRLRRREIVERRARDSNPQPVTRHFISNEAASHSPTLRMQNIAARC